MFNSLDDEMRKDDEGASNARERWLRYAMVLAISVVLFGSLYAGIRFLE
jgi:hypothetical protein